jgi:hypothetical protein
MLRQAQHDNFIKSQAALCKEQPGFCTSVPDFTYYSFHADEYRHLTKKVYNHVGYLACGMPIFIGMTVIISLFGSG